MAKRRRIDWEAVERDYRSGQLSLRQIAGLHGCSDGAIRKRAKKHKWRQDLTEEVRKETAAILAEEELEPDHRTTQRDVIDHAAARAVGVIREQRTKLLELNQTRNTLLGKLNTELEKEKRAKVDLYAATKIFGDLTRATSQLVDMERKVFNLDSPEKKEGTPKDDADRLTDEQLNARIKRLQAEIGAGPVAGREVQETETEQD